MAQADDLIPIPTLTDSMAKELVGKPVGDLAGARHRVERVAQGLPLYKTYAGPPATQRAKYQSDLSLILALPDREALAEMIRASVSQTCGINCEAMITASDERENELDAADRILSHLKGESSND